MLENVLKGCIVGIPSVLVRYLQHLKKIAYNLITQCPFIEVCTHTPDTFLSPFHCTQSPSTLLNPK